MIRRYVVGHIPSNVLVHSSQLTVVYGHVLQRTCNPLAIVGFLVPLVLSGVLHMLIS